jgi:NAD(P)-dependent dehydrogenase (short-subunit alcohol dehydrogenase family)
MTTVDMGHEGGDVTGTDSPKVALVTGGSRGMGAEVARQLASDGYAVAVADVRDCGEAVAAIREAGGTAAAYECDNRSWEQVQRLVETVERELGPLHVAAQVAGIYDTVPSLEQTHESWRRLLDVNVDGTFHVVRLAAEPMARRGTGAIVCIASTASWLAWDQSTHYLASKAAVKGLVTGAAYELGRFGVRVNAVAPGTIRTPATVGELGRPGVEEAEARATALGRIGEVTDIAQAVSFLADNQRAGWITGQTVVVDGGYSTHGENAGFGQYTDSVPVTGAAK